MNEIEKLKSYLKQAMEIASANIEKAENIDLEDMAQTLESFIDELDNIGDFETYGDLDEGFIRMNQLAGIITESQAKKMMEASNKTFTSQDIQSLATNLDTEFNFSPKTLKGKFTDLGISFTLSPDQSQLILKVTPNIGYDDPQDFVDDIQSEIGFPEYNFEVKGTQVFITKK